MARRGSYPYWPAGRLRPALRDRQHRHEAAPRELRRGSQQPRCLDARRVGDRSRAPRGLPVSSNGQISVYNDAGSTACGFHVHFGVANKSLPCGTKVTFSHGGRSVVATVDDRGPYVAGRDYDLNQNTAGALGMYAVATVLASR